MALTDEQKARMNANRRKAIGIQKRGKDKEKDKEKEKTPPPASTFAPPPSALRPPFASRPTPPAATFVPKSVVVRTRQVVLRGHCSLVSRDRFEVKIGFHDAVVAAIKSLKTGRYNAAERSWSLGVEEHYQLAAKVSDLKPDVVLESLPKWIAREFSKKKMEIDDNDDEARSALDPFLWDSLMPFQREGVKFALSRGGRVYLADDMGLGKTIQALAVAAIYRDDMKS
jgi:hypothetical protein